MREDVYDAKTEELIFKSGTLLDSKSLKKAAKSGGDISIVPFVSDEVVYLSADAEDKYTIAQANSRLTENKEFSRERISCRYHSGFLFSNAENIDYMDVAPHQVVGISAALIPFLEHDDANRALMGSNMMAQAVPLIRPEIPLVSTGMEGHAALDSARSWSLKRTAKSSRSPDQPLRSRKRKLEIVSINSASTSAPTRVPVLTSVLLS